MLGSFPPELRGRLAATSLLRSKEPTLSCNHSSRHYCSVSAHTLQVVIKTSFTSQDLVIDFELGVKDVVEACGRAGSAGGVCGSSQPGREPKEALIKSHRCIVLD
jgi:hypothetical protein